MATNFVKCSYQEVIDLHTESDRVTVIGIHTPTGNTPRRMFPGYFNQYNKYKYRGCSIKLVPAARLPADPSMVSYEGGQTALDARDLLNPIMFHGCHGNDMGTILNRLYGDNGEATDSLDAIEKSEAVVPNISGIGEAAYERIYERLYYKALTDRTWRKAHPQRGFAKGGLHPLLYSLATNRQIFPGSVNAGDLYVDDNSLVHFAGGDPTTELDTNDGDLLTVTEKTNLRFMTPRLTRLGWMDTRNVTTVGVNMGEYAGIDADDLMDKLNTAMISQENFAELEKLFMGIILLPPAYKTEQYFRMIVNHYFAFKGFRGISLQPDINVPSYWNKNGDGTGEYDLIGTSTGRFTDFQEGE